MYYGNRTEWSASEQSVIIRVINLEVDRPICFSTRMITGTIELDDRKQKSVYQFIITNTKFATIISDSFNFCLQKNKIFL